jgi:hypothetical protein
MLPPKVRSLGKGLCYQLDRLRSTPKSLDWIWRSFNFDTVIELRSVSAHMAISVAVGAFGKFRLPEYLTLAVLGRDNRTISNVLCFDARCWALIYAAWPAAHETLRLSFP